MADKEDLARSIGEVGQKLRAAKEAKASSDVITPLVAELNTLKGQYKEVTGEDFGPPPQARSSKKKKPPAEAAAAAPEAKAPKTEGGGGELSKNEKKRRDKAAAKEAKTKAKEAVEGGSVEVAAATESPTPTKATPPSSTPLLCLTGGGGGTAASAHLDVVKCLAAASLSGQVVGVASGTEEESLLRSVPPLLKASCSVLLALPSGGSGDSAASPEVVFGANAVCRYLAGLGSSGDELVWEVDQWLEWEERVLAPPMLALLNQSQGAAKLLPIALTGGGIAPAAAAVEARVEYLVDYDEYRQIYQYSNMAVLGVQKEAVAPAAPKEKEAGTPEADVPAASLQALAALKTALTTLEAHLFKTGGELVTGGQVATVAEVVVGSTLGLVLSCFSALPGGVFTRSSAAASFPLCTRFVGQALKADSKPNALAAALNSPLSAAATAAATAAAAAHKPLLAAPSPQASSLAPSALPPPSSLASGGWAASLPPFDGGNFLGYLSSVFERAIEVSFPSLGGLKGGAAVVVRAGTKNRANADYQCNSSMEVFGALKGTPAGAALKKPSDVGDLLAAAVIGAGLVGASGSVIGALNVHRAGFINITVSVRCLFENAEELVKNGQAKPPKVGRVRNVAVDFSSPNIAKEMHVGHLRSTIIGDTISRILEFVGHKVSRLNHVGDWGTQFGMLILFLREAYPDFTSNPPNITDLTDFYRGAKKRFDEDEEFKKQAQLTVVQLQAGDEECHKVWRMLCDISRKEFDKVYERLGVVAEERGESFYNTRIPGTVDALVQCNESGQVKGEGEGGCDLVTTTDNGALTVFLESVPFGRPTGGASTKRHKVSYPLFLRKGDGGYGYDSTDLTAIKHRLHEMGVDWVVYVTDKRQAEHFFMCFECARRANWLQDEADQGSGLEAPHRFEHVGFGMVCGEDGKPFKTRAGDTVRLVDLLDESAVRMRASLDERVAEGKCAIKGEDLAAASRAIGYGAVKYFDLKQHPETDYKFTYDAMLSTQGNTAVYLLFAYARLASIVRKGKDDHGVDIVTELKALQGSGSSSGGGIALRGGSSAVPMEKEELLLALELCQLPDVLELVLTDLMPHRICDYLYDLCCVATGFVTKCFVLDAKQPSVMRSRLVLCAATCAVMRQCFSLLGINPLERI